MGADGRTNGGLQHGLDRCEKSARIHYAEKRNEREVDAMNGHFLDATPQYSKIKGMIKFKDKILRER